MSNRFPTPVGGNVTRQDLAPSVVFLALHFVFVPLLVFQLVRKRTTIQLFGIWAFGIERVVLFTLRLLQSIDYLPRDSSGLLIYQQLTIGVGFLAIPDNLITLQRCALVNTTYADEATGREDQPKKRAAYRGSTGLFRLTFLAATVPGIVGFQKSGDALGNPDSAQSLFVMRYASTAVGLVLILLVAGSLISSIRNTPALRSQCGTLLVFYVLMTIVCIYRLAVMNRWETSITDPGPTQDKVLFYIFQITPEWISMAYVFTADIRTQFGTGFLGDYKANDKEDWIDRRRKRKAMRKAAEAEESNLTAA